MVEDIRTVVLHLLEIGIIGMSKARCNYILYNVFQILYNDVYFFAKVKG